jgi:hypothetical protein
MTTHNGQERSVDAGSGVMCGNEVGRPLGAPVATRMTWTALPITSAGALLAFRTSWHQWHSGPPSVGAPYRARGASIASQHPDTAFVCLGSKAVNLGVSISRRLCTQYRTSSLPKQNEGSLRRLGAAHRALHYLCPRRCCANVRNRAQRGVQKSLPISADSRSANSMVSAISFRVSKNDWFSYRQ